MSVAVNGAAAGLYFFDNTQKQINFVLPVGLSPGVASVVINNNGTVLRGFVLIVFGQPDVFSSTLDALGRAVAFNVTNPMSRTGEPFSVTSTDASGASVPTVIELTVTGVRNVVASEVTVTVGTTAITGASITFVGKNTEMPGFDFINFTLPAALAGAGDVPVIVSVTRSGATFTSRPADTAPRITIN